MFWNLVFRYLFDVDLSARESFSLITKLSSLWMKSEVYFSSACTLNTDSVERCARHYDFDVN